MKKTESSKDSSFLVKKMKIKFKKNSTDAYKYMLNGKKKGMKRKKRFKKSK